MGYATAVVSFDGRLEPLPDVTTRYSATTPFAISPRVAATFAVARVANIPDVDPFVAISLYGRMAPLYAQTSILRAIADLIPLFDTPQFNRRIVLGGDLNVYDQTKDHMMRGRWRSVLGMTVVAACLVFRMSRRCYYRWLPRWRAEGEAGLLDRSSRPRRSPQRLSVAAERQIAGLREATGFGPDRIGALLGLPPSTCHRALGRLGYLDRVRVAEPVVRYEIAEPGGLLHLDTKKLGRLGAGSRPPRDR